MRPRGIGVLILGAYVCTAAFCHAPEAPLSSMTSASEGVGGVPTETVRAPGLSASADVVTDGYGWPHVSAGTLRDAAFGEGYAMARDRMMQLELFRRTAEGTLSEVYGALSTQFLQSDVTMRTLGLHRVAESTWEAMPPGRTRDLFSGFADGVTLYLHQIRSGEQQPPRGSEALVTSTMPDWSPVDSLAVLRLMEVFLSFNADEEINRTLLRDRARDVFDEADPAAFPERAARRGFFSDVMRFDPPSAAVVVPGFYASRAPARHAHVRYAGIAHVLPRRVEGQAAGETDRSALASTLSVLRRLFPGTAHAASGTNGWAVDAAHSASGHALLANDPHLPLLGPSILWGVHLVVTGGADALDVTGTAFPGVPGVVFGHNVRVAWGITNAMFDQMDVYDEAVDPGVGGAPDAVRFQGRDVPIERRIESVPDGYFGTRDVVIETVPHHGPILPRFSPDGEPLARTGTTALSVRWVGSDVTHETDALTALLYANDVIDAQHAVRAAEIPSLGFIFADVTGAVAYRATGQVPIRASGALTFDPVTAPYGAMPAAVLPGTGEAEWIGTVDPDSLPHTTGGPGHGWVAAANNDPAGLSASGNPFREPVYLGYDWAPGFRAERIDQRLDALGTHATREDMASLQTDHVLLVAPRFLPFLHAAVARVEQEWANPGTHPELSSTASLLAARAPFIRDADARLAAWSFDATQGTQPGASDAERADSVAAALFHAWLGRVLDDAFSDEIAALASSTPGAASPTLSVEQRMVAALFLLEHPDRSLTLDAATGESTLWNDLRTPGVRERRDGILVLALAQCADDLTHATGSGETREWLWGTVHTVRFASVLPHFSLSLFADLSIPPPGDPLDPAGFARGGGIDSVDQAWPTLEDDTGEIAPVFTYSEGPARRFTIEMAPEGPRAWDALPGGESDDPASTHFRDEAAYWRFGKTHPLLHDAAEIASFADARVHLEPVP